MALSGKSTMLGLLGWPVSHSFSPAMHNAAIAALGLDAAYVPLPVEPNRVGEAVAGLRALGFRGANVTIPHKQAVMPFLDEIDPAAQAIGAVNTITVDSETGRLHGTNTDHGGFMRDLAGLGVEPAGTQCLLIGAGGSARAVAYGLAKAEATVTILARRQAPAKQIVDDLRSYVDANRLSFAPLEAAGDFRHVDLIVNATPVGMSPHIEATPWPTTTPFPQASLVYDLIYNPRETRLMQQAVAANGQAANGLGMLLYQGALAFEHWMGIAPPIDVMGEAIARFLG